ncbi:hypothetical protein SAMN05444422_1151 [Halobiforma haloterrestris]|uniref:Uncharacterized protein n=1 Tax=Natronobacterium haloterrestre TaxID=148448 RepID=A0A1I1L7K9_NATHA|nr:hypothetical protein SAMN05444422_1151 [Halobiforma haloterrestris]
MSARRFALVTTDSLVFVFEGKPDNDRPIGSVDIVNIAEVDADAVARVERVKSGFLGKAVSSGYQAEGKVGDRGHRMGKLDQFRERFALASEWRELGKIQHDTRAEHLTIWTCVQVGHTAWRREPFDHPDATVMHDTNNSVRETQSPPGYRPFAAWQWARGDRVEQHVVLAPPSVCRRGCYGVDTGQQGTEPASWYGQ